MPPNSNVQLVRSKANQSNDRPKEQFFSELDRCCVTDLGIGLASSVDKSVPKVAGLGFESCVGLILQLPFTEFGALKVTS